MVAVAVEETKKLQIPQSSDKAKKKKNFCCETKEQNIAREKFQSHYIACL